MDLKMMLEPTYTLDVQAKSAKHWIIIGAGGNGGYLIPQLLRQISLQNKELKFQNRPQHTITIIDADSVEDKNLQRQNFLPRDVGYNKAEVMANRYGMAFGLEVNYIPEYLESEKMLKDIIKNGTGTPIVIGAVDNNATRALVYNVFKDTKGMFWLDAGNEEWAGQVVVGYNAGKEVNKDNREPHLFNLPSVADIYPEILDGGDKLPGEMSCAERAVSNPQNIQTNQNAANLMMNFCNTILTAKANEGEGLKAHQVIFNTTVPSFTTTLNKLRFLVPQQEEAPKAEVEVEVVKTPKKRAPRKKKTETTEEATV
jgi:PRTRC genetic system ThiF family protein